MSAVGQANPFSDASEYNTLDFIIARALDDMQTVSIGEVIAVDTGAQTVNVQILVNLVTGSNTPVEHEVIANRPYFRLQGGGNAIICDPEVGDIGVVVFASRDITGVVAAKGAANPSSNRKFSWSDGVYLGGVLNSTPAQYIKFLAAGAGINIVSPGTVAIQAPATTISGTANVAGDTTLQATLAVTGASTLTGAVAALGGITTTTIAGASAVFSGSVTASSFIGGGGGGGSVTSVGISTGGVGVVVGGGPITSSGTLTVDLSTTAYAALALAVTALQTAQSQNSITGAGTSGSKLQLVNDSATPGANMVYGTNGSGTKGWQTAGGGSAEPFNITPDSHPVTPTGVGLGPNDEFEYSTSLDTAGARYASADAWITVNWSALGGTTTAPVAQGNLQFISEVNPSGTRDPQLAVIPLAGGWVSYVAKFNVNFQGGGGNLGGIVLYEIGTGKTLEWSVFNGSNSSFFNRTIPASIAQVGGTSTNPMPVDSFTGAYPYRYFRVLQSGANVVFQVSLDGIMYTTLTSGGTLAIATYFTTAPTHIGFVIEGVSSSVATILNADFIRQTA